MTHAVAVLRVSTESQAESGLGLDGQRAAIEAFAAKEGLTVASWHTDAGVSGSADLSKRLGLMAALAELKAGSVLVCSKRDRLSRDELLSAWLSKEVAKKGARILSAAGEGDDSTPAGKLMRRIIESFAEYERQIIMARTRAAVQAKRARGLAHGHPPYGWSADASKRLQPHADEQAILARIRALRASGASWRAITETLNSEGVPSKLGGAWHPTQTRRAFARAT